MDSGTPAADAPERRATLSERWARGGMPPWVPRLLWMIVGMALLTLLAIEIAGELRELLTWLLIALFLSTALEPGVTYLNQRGMRRGVATGLIFVVLVVLGLVLVGLMVPLVVDQTRELIRRVPDYVDQINEFTEGLGLAVSGDRTSDALTGIESNLQDLASDLAGNVFGVGTRILGTVFALLTIGLFTFYMVADGPRMRRNLLQFMPQARQREVLRAWDIAIDKTGGYFYSRALLAAVAGFFTWVALRIIGVPFALPLSIWVGIISQFVPTVGTYIAGAVPVLVAFLEDWRKGVAVLVFIVVYQQVENYAISPKVTAHTMSLHPAVAFGSAIVGVTLLGAAGALMALPIAATLQAFVSTYLERHRVIESELTQGPVRPEPRSRRRTQDKDP